MYNRQYTLAMPMTIRSGMMDSTKQNTNYQSTSLNSMHVLIEKSFHDISTGSYILMFNNKYK